MNLEDLINSNEVTIIDVRTNAEFVGGAVSNSLNIPLNEVPEKVGELMKMQPMVMCCAAGIRSAQAVNFLKQAGVEKVYNGGSWQEVNSMIKK